MKRFVILLIICFSPALITFAQQDPNDPGMQDSLIVDSVAVPQGQSTVNVAIYAVTDDSVASYDIPMHWTPDGIGGHLAPNDNYGPLSCFIHFDTTYEQFVNFGGVSFDSNCFLNTDNIRTHIITLHFILPINPPQVAIVIDTATDIHGGSMFFGLWDGITGFVPAFKRGMIIIGEPVSIDEASKPTTYSLNENYPNPFNPSTNIDFSLPKAGRVSLEIYDILGQRVRRLLDDKIDAGQYSIIWDGENGSGLDVPSGTYFYKLTSGDYTQTKKMLLIR
jgi:hypothetical protein